MWCLLSKLRANRSIDSAQPWLITNASNERLPWLWSVKNSCKTIQFPQAVQFGKMMFTHNFSPHNSLLWNNRVITINKKSLFKSDWFNNGLMFVYELLKPDGRFFSFEDFTTKYNIIIPRREYEKICKAIPIPLIQLIHNSMLFSSVIPSANSKDWKCQFVG